MKKYFAFILLSTCSFKTVSAQKVFNAAKMDSLFAVLEKNDKMMGTLTVSRDGKPIYQKAIGYRQLSGKVRNTPETKFRIGSITKTFTATMVLQLIEEGKLSLQHKLGAYFPEVPNANDISIGQMLTHHSGLYNFTDSLYMTFHTQPKSQKEILDIISRQKPVFKPGENSEYSNTNYILLGYILEKVTGKTFAENLKTRICNKQNLKNTYIGGKIQAKNNEAYSYSYNGNQWIPEDETDMSLPGAAGAIVSNTADLTKFINALFSEKLINKSSLDSMTTIRDGYGMGIFQAPFYDKKGYMHNGGIDGFSASLAYFPDDKLTVALLTNGMAYQMNDIMLGILSIYYDKDYKIPEFKKAVKIAENLLERYEGVYASKDFPLKITVKKEGDHLTAQATGQGAFPLAGIDESEFRFDAAGIVMQFLVESNGAVKQFHLNQRGMSYLFEKE